MKNKKTKQNKKKYIKVTFFDELATLTRDVTCSKL